MPTLRDTTDDRESLDVPRRRCKFCRRLVMYMLTCHNGAQFAFDAEPCPARYDDGSGWAPGMFYVGGRLRMCMAPMPLHPPAKRRRIAHVMQIHTCRVAA